MFDIRCLSNIQYPTSNIQHQPITQRHASLACSAIRLKSPLWTFGGADVNVPPLICFPSKKNTHQTRRSCKPVGSLAGDRLRVSAGKACLREIVLASGAATASWGAGSAEPRGVLAQPRPRSDSADCHHRQRAGDHGAVAGCADGRAAGGEYHGRRARAADDDLRAAAAGVQRVSVDAAGDDAGAAGAQCGDDAVDSDAGGHGRA